MADQIDPTKVKPFIKWAGGKTKLLPEITKRLPDAIRDYYEPFLGGGAVFFHLKATDQIKGQVYLSDVNPDLVNAYQVVRDEVETLIVWLKKHQQNHAHWGANYYYGVRDFDRQAGYSLLSPVERAARFIYLNKTAFNGLYRQNSKGHFNVPIGDYKNPVICDVETLRNCSALLQGVSIECHSFENIEPAAGSFVYMDPPYVPLSATSNFTSYSKDGFGFDDQVKLWNFYVLLVGRGVRVLQSNSSAEVVYQLYQEFAIDEIYAARSVGSKAATRQKVKEVLIRSY